MNPRIPADPTPEDVIAVAAHLGERFNFRIERKQSSELMALCGQVLDLLGIQRKETFCGSYCTTIPDLSGKCAAVVYLTFDPGETGGAVWSAKSQHDVIAHEAGHALQIARDGAIMFSAGYLANRSARTLYEVECYGQRYELAALRGEPMPTVDDVVDHLRGYGLREGDFAVAGAAAGSLRRSALAGGIGSEIVRELVPWWADRRPAPSGFFA